MSLANFIQWIEKLDSERNIREIYICHSTKTYNTLDTLDNYKDIRNVPEYVHTAINQIIDLPLLNSLIEHAIEHKRHWVTSGDFDNYGFTYSIHNNGKTSFTVIIEKP